MSKLGLPAVAALALALPVCLTPRVADAGEPEFEAPAGPPVRPEIEGGQNATTCQWPTSVTLFNGMGLCSGTLVHPRVVTTAAHCIHASSGGAPSSIRFGEQTFQPAFQVPVDTCMYNPQWNGQVGSSDYAFCTLSQDVDLPPTPPMMGCELEQLVPGAEVAIVGFGNNNDNSGAGTKRWGYTTIQEGTNDQLVVAGEMAVSTCNGDSGGSGYFRMADGGWRAWGMLSGGPENCGNEGYYVNMAHAAAWIEAQSGYDITPCHDADGTWNPGPDCDGFASDPLAGGSWNQNCPGPVGSEPATCGPGMSAPEDLNPPDVAFSVPTAEQVFPDDMPTTFDIVVDADDPEYAVVRVELYVNDMFTTERSRDAWAPVEPWVFANASFPAGAYSLRAVAFDYAGNSGEAEVTFVVGDPPGDGDGDPGAETGDETETGGDETRTTGLPIDPVDAGGCSCRASARDESPIFAGLGLLALIGLGVRRRREPR